jgi:hypothetical protein
MHKGLERHSSHYSHNQENKTMKTFNATIYTEFNRYDIDLKPDGHYNLICNGKGTYHKTLQDAMHQIEYYYDQDLDRAIEQENSI